MSAAPRCARSKAHIHSTALEKRAGLSTGELNEVPPKHPPIVSMLKEMYADAARVEAERNERNRLTASPTPSLLTPFTNAPREP